MGFPNRFYHRYSVSAFILAFVLFGFVLRLQTVAIAQKKTINLPSIAANNTKGKPTALKTEGLYDFELDLLECFARKDAPHQVLALASSYARDFYSPYGTPDQLITIAIYGTTAELRWRFQSDTNRYFYRTLSADEVRSIQSFVLENKIVNLAPLKIIRTIAGKVDSYIGGQAHIFLWIDQKSGYRIYINNPPIPGENDYPKNDPVWRYRKLIDFCRNFTKRGSLKVHYSFRRPKPGFKVLYAHPDQDVVAVWKQKKDICVSIDRHDRTFKKEHHVLRDGKLGENVSLGVTPRNRYYKVGSRAMRHAAASTDGKWIVGRSGENDALVCYDQTNGKFVPIVDDQTRTTCYPLAYIDAWSMFLLARFRVDLWELEDPIWLGVRDFRLLDPKTGKAITVDMNTKTKTPWFQKLPQRLLPANSKKNTFWIAVKSRQSTPGTTVGSYDMKRFRWVTQQWIDELSFETKDMWIDEDVKKIYVAYKGHLVSFPLQDKRLDYED